MVERIVIVDYGSGNLRSVEKALARAADAAGAHPRIHVSGEPDVVAAADRVVLPGVGAFSACRAGLEAVNGLLPALERAVLDLERPFLGVCVGMQLLASRGLEFGVNAGLGWIPGEVEPFVPSRDARAPHMGWSEVNFNGKCALFPEGADHFYFAHSYRFVPENDSCVVGRCHYGAPFAAAVAARNLAGVQFHPEKSQGAGLALLARFLRWRP